MTECLQPWIIAISVVGALLAVLVLVLLLALVSLTLNKPSCVLSWCIFSVLPN